MPAEPSTFAGDRLAKVIARAGLCSRREAELWIKDGRVSVNGKPIRTPAFNVTARDNVVVDGKPLVSREGTRVWLYHKPAGLVVTEKDPEGRETIFETLATQGLPRVVSVGRLDINTEGLLLLTNDGGLKRVLELPATGWLRRYRVRAFGTITQPQLTQLAEGLEVDGVKYGPIEATLERAQGSNVWLLIGLREGKNREVKNVLGALGLKVNRLIRVSFGPFQLGDLPIGAVEVVKARVLREQLGKRLADEAGVDFDSDLPEPQAIRLARRGTDATLRAAAPGKPEPKQRRRDIDFRFADRPDRPRSGPRPQRREEHDERPVGPPRRVFNPDGTESVFEAKTYGKKPKRDAASPTERPPFRKGAARPPRSDDRKPFARGPRADFGDRPKRSFDDRPRDGRADRPKRSFDDKPRSPTSDRPKRPYSGRPAADADARPRRSVDDKPRGGAGDRPKRPYSGRPSTDGEARPKRAYGDKPRAAPGDRPKRPYTGRPAADGEARPKRSFGDKPRAPRAPRAAGAEMRAPRGPRPSGDKPLAKRPRSSGPKPDRPRGPRPSRA